MTPIISRGKRLITDVAKRLITDTDGNDGGSDDKSGSGAQEKRTRNFETAPGGGGGGRKSRAAAMPHTRPSTEPVAGFKFGVEIAGIVDCWFSECSGLSVEREIYTFQEGGINEYEHKLPGRLKQSTITLKRGIASNDLWTWFNEELYTDKKAAKMHELPDISIVLFNGDRTEVKRWNLKRAFPIKWTGPDLNTEGNQVAFETIEIAHHGLEMIDWSSAALKRV